MLAGIIPTNLPTGLKSDNGKFINATIIVVSDFKHIKTRVFRILILKLYQLGGVLDGTGTFIYQNPSEI